MIENVTEHLLVGIRGNLVESFGAVGYELEPDCGTTHRKRHVFYETFVKIGARFVSQPQQITRDFTDE